MQFYVTRPFLSFAKEMLPYKTLLDRIKESERVTERLNHHIQRYGLQIATVSVKLFSSELFPIHSEEDLAIAIINVFPVSVHIT